MLLPAFLQESASDAAAQAAAGSTVLLFALAITVVMIVSMWKIFERAGQPGWMSIIPILNFYVMLKIVGKPGWWMLLLFVPLVNIIVMFIVTFGLAQRFNKSALFGLGLIFLPFFFYPMLAFGDNTALPQPA